MNKKRIQRLWREADLKVPKKQHKRRRLAGSSENSVSKKSAGHPGHVWSYDFAFDQTEDGRRVKVVPVVEEYTRECLALPTERLITSEQVIQTLSYLFASRGAPDYIRSDNGPEFIAEAVKAWLASSGVKTLYIEPGSPWENAYSETFVSRMRDELLDREVFANVAEAKVLTSDYREYYNRHRPHGGLSIVRCCWRIREHRRILRGAVPAAPLSEVQRCPSNPKPSAQSPNKQPALLKLPSQKATPTRG